MVGKRGGQRATEKLPEALAQSVVIDLDVLGYGLAAHQINGAVVGLSYGRFDRVSERPPSLHRRRIPFELPGTCGEGHCMQAIALDAIRSIPSADHDGGHSPRLGER